MLRIPIAFAFLVGFAVAQETAAANCKKGIPCGNSCIAANKVCRIGSSSATSQPDPRLGAPTAGLSSSSPSSRSVLGASNNPSSAVIDATKTEPTPSTVPIPSAFSASAQNRPAAPMEPSKWLFQAEATAKGIGCAPPHAAMTAKGPGLEMINVTCPNGTILAVRCEFNGCRVLQ